MDLRDITATHWDQIGRSLASLTAFVGLALCGALSLLCRHAVFPAVAHDETAGGIRWLSMALVPISTLAMLGAVVALAWGLYLAIQVLSTIFPRFLI